MCFCISLRWTCTVCLCIWLHYLSVFLYLVVLWVFAACFCIWLHCEHLQRVSVFGSIASICSAFLYWFALWVFVVRFIWRCFILFYFSSVVAHWALSATAQTCKKESGIIMGYHTNIIYQITEMINYICKMWTKRSVCNSV